MKFTLSLLLPILLLISSALAYPSPSWLLTLRRLHNRQANTTSVGGSTYTVVSGDTLFAIASAAGISLASLESANPDVVPTSLQVGQVINIPTTPDGSNDNSTTDTSEIVATEDD